jgi:hypothetical protein
MIQQRKKSTNKILKLSQNSLEMNKPARGPLEQLK